MKKIIAVGIFLITLLCASASFADILSSWDNPDAYKPEPILFVHGIGNGSPNDWNTTCKRLNSYFSKYYQYPLSPGQAYRYLETVNLQDNGSTNGSVDAYPDGRLGLAGRLALRINELIASNNYAYTDKLNIAAHSAGGVVTRWCFIDYPAVISRVDKLILIGVPNRGSPLAGWLQAATEMETPAWQEFLAPNIVIKEIKNPLLYGLSRSFLTNIDPHGALVEDLDPASPLMRELNNPLLHPQPEDIDYFGIIGVTPDGIATWAGDFNWFFFNNRRGGDGIVSKDSQLAPGNVNYKEWKQIPFNHLGEIEAASGIPQGTRNDILYYFDSVMPELKVIDPDPSAPGPAEIFTYYLRIRGEVRKEYLPADTKLIISGVKLDDGVQLPAVESLLEPSNLWRARDPSTPVAEFDQLVSFAATGNGNYKVFLQLENPAGIRSEIKEVRVRVNNSAPAFVIVHCHNPEGKEIASIEGVPRYESYPDQPGVAYPAVRIDCDGKFFAAAAYDNSTHNLPLYVTAGPHIFSVRFNGMQAAPQVVSLSEMETKTLTFNFPRQEFDYNGWIAELSAQGNITVNESINLTSPPYYTWQYKNDFKLFPGMNNGGVNGGASLFPSGGYYTKLNYSTYSEISLTGTSYHDYVWAKVNSLTSDNGTPLFGIGSSCSLGEAFNKNFASATTDFRYWYSQSIRNGYYPSISVGLAGIPFYLLFGYGPFDYPAVLEGGYACRMIPAQLNYSLCEIKGGNRVGIGNSEWHRDEYTSPQEKQHDGTIAVKISSVPYDLTGSAI